MDFMQLISEKECSLERYAKEQSTQKRPLIIYGAGYGARILIPYFQRYGIDDFNSALTMVIIAPVLQLWGILYTLWKNS